MKILDVYCGAYAAAMETRFWSYVDRRSPDECWEWTGSRRPGGYGQMMTKARVPVRAHRLSFVIAFGWEPPAVLHKCDNPPCVNPRHLMGGTQAENMADMKAKGRQSNYVTDAVRSTVLALREGGMSCRAIGRQVGVDQRTVSRIVAAA